MKILFSPEFSGHVYIGLSEQQPQLMDTIVCDIAGLVGMLELRLGIHHEDYPEHYRMVKYFEALSKYMKQHPDNALAASFKLSSLGTAEQALRWRDNLVMNQWSSETVKHVSGRLDVIADTEALFDCPGIADRMLIVLDHINNVRANFFDGVEIELPYFLDLLHPTIAEIIDAMRKAGAEISIREWDKSDSICNRFAADCISVNGKTVYANDLGGQIAQAKDASKPVEIMGGKNLLHVSHLLQSHSKARIVLNKEDRSFLIYKFTDERAAEEYMAFKGSQLGADVWINADNKSLDNWLRMMGKPTMGSSMTAAAPQLVQLFVQGIDMMKEPLNIHSIISWLYSPMQPFGSFFGGILAETIISEGGFRNEKCYKVVEKYIAGEYAYHDQEEEAKLSESELLRLQQKEEKERKSLVKTFLPSFEKTDNTAQMDAQRLKTYLNSLAGWARSRSHYLREKPSNEGWCSQLESLAQMCETFILLMDSAGVGDKIDVKQVDSWISTLYKGESFMQYASQKGSVTLIDSPAKMAAHSRKTIWMNFMGGNERKLDCSFLYHSEREKIRKDLKMWDEECEREYNGLMEKMPFFMTDEQLILVTTDTTDGELTPKHPIMVRLETQIENLEDFVVKPNLMEEERERVPRIHNNNTKSLITFDHADKLKWPDHLSPTAISNLVEYPFDFLMEKMLNIVSTGPGSIKDLKTTSGIVAHAVIEGLFAPRDGASCSKPDEIEERIKNEVSAQVRKQIEACGAILDLPENRLDAELLAEQLHRCLDILLEIIRENHLVVTGCEKLVKDNLNLLDNDEGWDMLGFIDMTLEDENHHPVVFDFKWTSSKRYYRDLLSANRSTQLELYRKMLSSEKKDAVERTAYFLMPEGHLYSKEVFEGTHCTQLHPENNDNIVEQLRQSFFYRKKQLDNGHVEVGDAFPVGMLDYFKDTEEKNLFPLALDEDGWEKENIFSNYKLFKV